MVQKRTRSSARQLSDEQRQPQDIESPIPYRSPAQQHQLAQALLAHPTLADRLRYLLDHESDFYVLNGQRVVDAEVIAACPRGLKKKLARVPETARWVESRTGHALSKQSLYNYRDGRQRDPRTAIVNGLAEFWRIDPLLLDPTADPHADTGDLDELEQRTLQLMTQVGFLGVKPREIKQSLGGSNTVYKRLFLDALEAIALDQEAHRGRHSSGDSP